MHKPSFVALARDSRVLGLLAGLGSLMTPSTLQAAIIETSTITNTYTYLLGTAGADGQTGSVADAGASGEVFATTRDSLGALGIQYTGRLDQNGNFAFLHNAYCVGDCFVSISTRVEFTIQNTDDFARDLRFDSLITPGHLGTTNGSNQNFGQFDFTVLLNDGGTYAAVGKAFDQSIVNNTGVAFNDLSTQSGPDWAMKQWGATPLSVDFTIGANSTATLTYSSLVRIDTSRSGSCVTLAACSGFQVAFGDPRNTGSSIPSLSAFSALSSPMPELSETSPLDQQSEQVGAVGQLFDPFTFQYRLVTDPGSTPFTLAVPAARPPAIVTTGFVNQGQGVGGVPEPSAWALLILGFGAVGGAMRRRARAARVAFA